MERPHVPQESSAHAVARGAAFLYGATIATYLFQFGYAAVTSRLVGSEGFGAYAIALTSAALFGTVSAGPVSAAAGRLAEVTRSSVSLVWKLAVVLGVGSGFLMLVSAPLWAIVWAAPDAVDALRLVAVSSLLTPLAAAGMAMMRRVGEFRRLAIGMVVANVAGMIVGLGAVVVWRSAAALLVSAVVSQALSTVVFALMLRSHAVGVGGITPAREFRTYVRTIGMGRVLAYISGSVGKLSVSHALGISALGQWNRAEVVSSVPIQQLQNAMVQSLYPEFRHDIDSPTRARRVWTDLLSAIAGTVWPALSLAAVGAYVAIPVLFGPGWDLAQHIVVVLALAGAIQMSTATLGAAVEALGVRSWVLIEQSVALAVQVAGAVLAVVTQSFVPVLVALPLSLAAHHVLDLTIASRKGYVDKRQLIASYGGSALVAGVIGLTVGGIALVAGQWGEVARLAVVIVFSAVILGAAWGLRNRLPAMRIARKYGVLKPATGLAVR